MRKIEQREFGSQFDKVDINFGRYYQTLELNDIILLMLPYLKEAANVSCETIKDILERYLQLFTERALNKPYIISPNDLFFIQVVEQKDAKLLKKREWFSTITNKKGYKFVLDKDAMWDSIVNGGNRHYEIVGGVKKGFEYCTLEFSEELKKRATELGRQGNKYLTKRINWGT